MSKAYHNSYTSRIILISIILPCPTIKRWNWKVSSTKPRVSIRAWELPYLYLEIEKRKRESNWALATRDLPFCHLGIHALPSAQYDHFFHWRYPHLITHSFINSFFVIAKAFRGLIYSFQYINVNFLSFTCSNLSFNHE